MAAYNNIHQLTEKRAFLIQSILYAVHTQFNTIEAHSVSLIHISEQP